MMMMMMMSDDDDDNSKKRAHTKQKKTLFKFVCFVRVGLDAQSGPLDTDHGRELGYVFTQWEGYPRADNKGDGEGQLDGILLRKR